MYRYISFKKTVKTLKPNCQQQNIQNKEEKTQNDRKPTQTACRQLSKREKYKEQTLKQRDLTNLEGKRLVRADF